MFDGSGGIYQVGKDPPHNHRVNAAERAIATFKEHFIAVLATVDAHWPLQLWDEFLPQVEFTLNMLHFSCRYPKKSANQEVYGTFDFNKTPLAPIGTNALIYDDPASRASWAPHATDGFMLGQHQTTTDAWISTFLPHDASTSLTHGAFIQCTPKSP
jgi:hypothetical protein